VTQPSQASQSSQPSPSRRSSLRELREDFGAAIARLVIEAAQGDFGSEVALVFDEGRIILSRKGKTPGMPGVLPFEDRLHMKGSLHYLGIAQDLNLYIGGKHIDTHHEVWDLIGKRWKEMDPLAAWGGDFASRDYNHFSFRYGGRA